MLPGHAGPYKTLRLEWRGGKTTYISPPDAKLTEDRKQQVGCDRSCFLKFFMSYSMT